MLMNTGAGGTRNRGNAAARGAAKAGVSAQVKRVTTNPSAESSAGSRVACSRENADRNLRTMTGRPSDAMIQGFRRPRSTLPSVLRQ